MTYIDLIAAAFGWVVGWLIALTLFGVIGFFGYLAVSSLILILLILWRAGKPPSEY